MPKPTPQKIDALAIAQRHKVPAHAIFEKGRQRARNRAARAEFANQLINLGKLSDTQAAAVMGLSKAGFLNVKNYEPQAAHVVACGHDR